MYFIKDDKVCMETVQGTKDICTVKVLSDPKERELVCTFSVNATVNGMTVIDIAKQIVTYIMDHPEEFEDMEFTVHLPRYFGMVLKFELSGDNIEDNQFFECLKYYVAQQLITGVGSAAGLFSRSAEQKDRILRISREIRVCVDDNYEWYMEQLRKKSNPPNMAADSYSQRFAV